MTLKQMLQTYAGNGSRSPHGGSPTTTHLPHGLPASVLDWPGEWRKRFEVTAEAVGRLLPIDALFAEAAAEIAVRLEYDLRQTASNTSHSPSWSGE